MNLIFLTQVGGLLKPFAWVMGMILNAIYKLVAAIGIPNIALCIVVFTIVVKMLMLPLTVKQQKFAKVSALITPELKELQEKYRGIDRSDREAMTRYTNEQQEIYQKYGSSPFGGCLPLLIMLPIIFALYRVIYAIPAYVTDVNAMYKEVASEVTEISKEEQSEFSDSEITQAIYEFYSAEEVSLRTKKNTDRNFTNTDLIDIFSVFNTGVWDDFRNGKQLESTEDLDVSTWNKLAQSEAFRSAMEQSDGDINEILKVNALGKYSILDAPGYKFPAVLIPIFAFLLQYLSGKLTNGKKKNKDGTEEEQPMPGMGMMNILLPVMSGVFCIFFPIGVGIYWVANSAVTIVQQLAVNKYFDRYDVQDIVEQNKSKLAQRNAKYGVHSTASGMSQIAKSSTKSIAHIETANIGEKNTKKNNASASSVNRSESGRITEEKKSELAKKAADNNGVAGIAAIANILKKDEDQ